MIYDCFLFFDEIMLLEIRLKELDSVVDKFVLVEATRTHSGQPKKLYYDEIKDNDVFAPYKDKITHVVYDKSSHDIRKEEERLQRNYISVGLKGAKPDDIIIVSDADEIVDHRVVPIMEKCEVPTRLEMKMYYYYFNCRANEDWLYPIFCRYRDFSFAHDMRILQFANGLRKGGWHFSYLVPFDQIPKKLESFSHAEYDTDFYKNIDRLKSCVENNTDIFNRPEMTFTIEPLDAPQCVMENEDKYRQFIKEQKSPVSYAGQSVSG